jgi:CubicO group peptidase (beta-lactamase class C family)
MPNFARLPDALLRGPAWQLLIDELAAKHQVPGVTVGILQLTDDGGADIRQLHTGVTSSTTGIEMTEATLHQYGSISKVWTATLIMQLLDEGLLTHDTPVVELLPDFTLVDSEAARAITVGNLLDHTSGIDGDLFFDTGDNDDCVQKYVDLLSTTTLASRTGGPLSYCNAGYVVLGRIVEVLRGMVWDEALAEYLLKPLGLENVITRAREAPLYRTAVGHVPTGRESPRYTPAPVWSLTRSMGPAGLVTGTATSLLTWAAAHLRDGRALNGTRILSTATTRMMRERRVDLTGLNSVTTGWASGWFLEEWGSETVIGHDGTTIGQAAFLDLFPARGLAITVLGNSPGTPAFERELRAILAAELGLDAPAEDPIDHSLSMNTDAILGTYESASQRFVLTAADGGNIALSLTPKTAIGGVEPAAETALLQPNGAERFVTELVGHVLEFAIVRDHGTQYLYMSRLYTKVV